MPNDIGEKIYQLRISKGLTLEQLGEKVGVGKSTVRKWETGQIANMRRDKISLIADALGVTASFLMGWEKKTSPVRIPVLGYVRAGIPIEAVEEVLDYEEISSELAATGEFFALSIKGDSMEPKISEGDVVIVRKQESVENGETAVVLVNGNDATVKKFYRTDSGVKLISTNPVYEPFFFTPKEVNDLPVSVIGKVVELRAKF